MQVGDLYYKRNGLNLVTIKIISINKNNVDFINLDTGIKRTHSKLWLNTHYFISKIFLLRGLLLDLDDKLREVSEEINEYELKVLLNNYKKR